MTTDSRFSLGRGLTALLVFTAYTSQLFACHPVPARDAAAERSDSANTPPPAAKLEVALDTLLPSTGQAAPVTFDHTVDVDDDGAARVNIPLWVPRGRAGLEPRLAITYSSRATDGLLGVGFALSGLSQISHCPTTSIAPVDYQGAEYCLDGQRLIPVTFSASEYRTEFDSYAKVSAVGAEAVTKQPLSFRVLSADGRVLTYGGTADSTLDATVRPQVPDGQGGVATGTEEPVRMSWMLSTVEDRAGNSMRVTYEKSAPADPEAWIRPLRLDYTAFAGNASAPAEPARRSVNFLYEPRPDVTTGFSAGVRLAQRHRLARIELRAPGPRTQSGTFEEAVLQRAYSLHYLNTSRTGRSLLSTLKECDGDAAAPACRSLEFPWAAAQQSYATRLLFNTDDAAPDAKLQVLGLPEGRVALDYYVRTDWLGKEEFDEYTLDIGEDLSRLILINPEKSTAELHKVARDSIVWAEGLCGKRQDTPAVYGPRVVDWSGIGESRHAALSCALGGGPGGVKDAFKFYRNTEHRTDVIFTPNARAFFWVDFNGDGSNELAWVENTNGSAQILRRKSPEIDGAFQASPPGTLHGDSLQLINLFGDGRQYLLGYAQGDPQYLHAVGGNQLGSSGWATSLPTPFFASWPPALIQALKPGLTVADLNGDGLSDVVMLGYQATLGLLRLDVSLNTGRGFLPPTTGFVNDASLVGAKVTAADINGDGRQDLVFQKPSNAVKVILGQEALAQAPVHSLPVASGDDASWMLVTDYNTDGLPDFVYRQLPVQQSPLYVATAKHRTDLLTGVNAHGLKHELTYEPLTTQNTPSTFKGTQTLRPTPASTLVVSRLQLTGASGTQRSWKHTYLEGRYQVGLRGSLGFAKHVVTDEQSGAQTTTEFANEHFLTARLPTRQVTTVPVTKNLTRTRTLTWGYKFLADGVAAPSSSWTLQGKSVQRYANVLTEVTTEGATTVSSSRTTLALDTYGIETARAETQSGAANGNPFEETTTTTHSGKFNPTTWLKEGSWDRSATWSCAGAGCTSAKAPPRQSRVTYDSLGRLTTVEVEPGSANEAPQPHESAFYLKRAYTYGPHGQLRAVEVTTKDGQRRESLEYDDLEALYPAQALLRVGGADKVAARFAFHPGLGVVAASEDAHGQVTRFQYDRFGRPRRVLPPDGSIEETTYALEANGQPITRTSTAGGGQRKLQVDELGRPVSDAHLGFGGDWVTVMTEYDALGRVRRASRPYRPTEPIAWETYTYDGLDRLTEQRHPEQTRVAHEYATTANGTLTSTRDEEDRLSHQLTDALGRLVESQEPLGAATLVTRFEHGAFGQRTAVRDPQGKRLEMTYDRVGRMEVVSDPNAGVGLRRFNGFGEVKWEANTASWKSAGFVTTYARDELGRLKELSSTRAGTLHEKTVFEWDSAANGPFKLASATRTPADATREVRTDYAYDTLGRPESTTRTIHGLPYITRQTYDAYGRPATLSYPGTQDGRSFTLEYTYTADGGLWNVHDVTTKYVYWTGYDYNGLGQPTSDRLGNGLQRTRRYDATGQLRFVDVRAGANPVQQLAYEYTPTGNLRARHDLQLKVTEDFKYDGLDRLQKWALTQNCLTHETDYLYSTSGNLSLRLAKGGTSASYVYDETTPGAKPHAVLSATYGSDVYSFQYDSQGNQTVRVNAQTKIAQTLEYTPFNLPEALYEGPEGQQGKLVATFDYDAAGARARKVSTQGEVVYLDGLYQKRTTGSDVRHLYQVNSPDGVVAEVEMKEGVTGQEIRYVLTDRFGTPDVFTDATGGLIERIKHDPFGERRMLSDLRQPYVGAYSAMRRGFTGHEQDDELGLTNMRGRIYDPRLARFLSPDPLIASESESQSYNAYAYVLNNPLRYTDPSGFDPFVISRSIGNSDSKFTWDISTSIFPAPLAAGVSAGSAAPAQPATAQTTDDLGTSTRPTPATDPGPPATALEAVGAVTAGLAVGAASGIIGAYGLGVLTAACPPCGLAVGIGLAAYALYGLYNGGAKDLVERGERLINGRGTFDDYYVGGTLLGGVATGGFVRGAFQRGLSTSGAGIASRALSMASTAEARIAGGGCFIAGTLVLTADGERPIEEIQVGDWVWAWNETTAEPGWHQVTQTFLKLDRAVLRLQLTADDGTTEELAVTAEHPFWVTNEGWVRAQSLELGTELQTASGSTTRVTALTMAPSLLPVYNLEVDEAHTYFVGRSQAWVHNTSSIGPGGFKSNSGIKFGQESVSNRFKNGPFKGKTIGEIVRALKSGKASADDFPLDFIVRNGERVSLNNRSLTALRRAGLEPTRLTNKTGNPFFERLLDSHLGGTSPSDVIRIRGGASNASFLE